MPHMAGFVSDDENRLFLRKFTVPYWALAHCYGKDAMNWWRLETALGRHSLVATAIKNAALLPDHIGCDAKHTCRHVHVPFDRGVARFIPDGERVDVMLGERGRVSFEPEKECHQALSITYYGISNPVTKITTLDYDEGVMFEIDGNDHA